MAPNEKEDTHDEEEPSSPSSANEFVETPTSPEPEKQSSAPVILDLADKSSVSYAGMFFCGIVLLVSLTWSKTGVGFKGHKYYECGIAVSVGALIFAALGFVLGRFNLGSDQATAYMNYFLFLWCFVGAAFMTFGGPFLTTGNGYFGSWGLAIAATMAVATTRNHDTEIERMKKAIGTELGVFTSSIITITAIATHGLQSTSDLFFSESLYGLLLAIFSVLLMSVFLFKDGTADVKCKPTVLMVLAVFWVVAACLLTFRGPFLTTGNGYFAAWGGAVTAVFAANGARQSRTAEK